MFIRLWIAFVVLAVTPTFGAVPFNDLLQKKVKLPYNTKVDISGKLTETNLGPNSLASLVTVDSVTAAYTINNAQTKTNPAPVNGDAWSVTVGPFADDQTIDLNFQFSGKLTADEATRIWTAVLGSAEFRAAFDTLVTSTLGQDTSVAVAKMQLFATAVEELVKKNLKPGLSLGNTHLQPTFPLLNFPNSLTAWKNLLDTPQAAELKNTLAGTTAADYVSKARGATPATISAALAPGGLTPQVVEAARTQMVNDWDAVTAQLKLQIVADLSIAASVITSAEVQELKKYAGFDAAAIYIPRLHEMRAFFTGSIYLGGPVTLTPNGQFTSFRDRLSLTFGVSVADLSGGDNAKSKIKADNAFLYGLGFRLNKYFRITAGGVLYRTGPIDGVSGNLTNKLRHEFAVGPSIDITALPGLRTIFAAGTGTNPK